MSMHKILGVYAIHKHILTMLYVLFWDGKISYATEILALKFVGVPAISKNYTILKAD